MNSDLIRRLIEAGTPAHLVAEVAVELGRAQAAAEVLEKRRRKDRERKANLPQNPRNSTESEEAAESSEKAHSSSPLHGPPSFPQTPNQPPLNPPATSENSAGGHDSEADDAEFIEVEGDQSEAKIIDLNEHLAETPVRGTRLPAGWQPTEKLIATARQEGLTDAQIERELARFRDYWLAATGRNATKRDWDATFRNWVREAADRQRRSGRSSTGGYGSQGGSLLRAYQRAAARFDDPLNDAQ